ncbi:MAG: diguanylate cyclase [Thioalkalivibrio sp.]|nr:diguanylate cyclase [Thioalkalivibrio sp.]
MNPKTNPEIPKALMALAIVVSVIAIATVDLTTGSEMRIFPLYFLPLTMAAWHFGKGAAILASVAMTSVWMGALYAGGVTYSALYVWPVNFFAQVITFLVVSLLVAKLREEMRHERTFALTDPLTGIPNRRAFFQEGQGVLASCNRHARSATLAYLDLDNFKSANDRFGHEHGDKVLCRVADGLAESLRSSDVIGRVGGDEFVVLLPETTTETAGPALEKVYTLLRDDPLLSDAGVTVSIGAVSYAHAPEDLNEMVQAADSVMYRLKETSKDGVLMERGPQNGLEHHMGGPSRRKR